MTKDRERRLRRLEELYPLPQEPSELLALLPYMTVDELRRLENVLQLDLRDNETSLRVVSLILERAKERKDRQLTQREMQHLEDLERKKRHFHERFVRAIGSRHSGFYPSADRFDALDFSVDEIERLTEVVTQAAAPDDLAGVSQLIEKLRVDGRPVTLENFAAIVFEARLGEKPNIC